MQTGQVFAAEGRRISPGTRSAALAASRAGQWDSSQCWLCVAPSAAFWDCHTSVRHPSSAAAALRLCWCLQQQAAARDKKFLGSLVQQFPYHKQRATDKKILRACLSVPVNMKICCAPPTVRKGSGIIHWILVLPATQSIMLSYFALFHVKVFTGKLPDCNWNVKAPTGNTFLLLILLLHSFMWQFCCSLVCRMHLYYTKKSHHLLILHSQYLHHADLTAPALWKAETHSLLCHMATSVLQWNTHKLANTKTQ